MSNRRAFLPATLLLCVFSSAIFAEDSPFIVDSWSTEQGLPQSSVISVIQTRDGYLWLGTLNGLVRFDGIHFTVFDENNLPGLDSDRIVFLFEDNETNLWVGTDPAGLLMIKNGVVKKFGNVGEDGNVIYAFEEAPRDILFVTENGKLLRFHDDKMDLLSPNILSPQFAGLAFKTLVPSKSGGVWQMFNGTVQKWQKNRLEKDFGSAPWGNTVVKAALEDDEGDLIVGTWGSGIYWLNSGGDWQNISTNQGLSSVYVLSLCKDEQGNLWAGTDGGGLDRIKRKIFRAPDEIPPLVAKSISEDVDGGLWTAFNAHGFFYSKTNAAQSFGPAQGIDPNAWSILVDKKQTVWAGTRSGLFQLQTNRFIRAHDAEIPGAQIFSLFEDRSGQVWAGTQNGLANFDGQNWKLFTTRDGFSENSIRAIAQDTNGDFWIGTENHGLNFFADRKFSAVRQSNDGLPGDDISCLLVDRQNVLWAGTFAHGLARLQDGKWLRFSTTNGLASDSISYVIEDDGGNLWVGSNMGLMQLQKKSLDDFVDGKVNSVSCRTYGKTDGLPTRECSSGSQPAAIRARDGRLFFPTTKGVVSVNPAELKPNLQPPQIFIESVRIDGVEQKTNLLDSAWSQSVVIPPGHEQLEIDYTALNFSAPDAVRFRYILEGHETIWTDAKSDRTARYPKLSPGNYHFHVIAANEDGVWNETGAVLEITVQPYFWQTGWFRVALIVFLLGIVISIVRYISTQKLRRELQLHKQQEALERERARIARDLHDQLGANLTQVALLGEMAGADKNSPDEIELHAKQISETARETTHSLDEIVWAINPSNDTLEGLANYACKYAQEYLALAGLRNRVDLPVQLPTTTIPPEVRHNVFLAFKEAVNNVVKHAQASEVWIRLRLPPDSFTLEIEDNGRGIGNEAAPQNRNGLRNMRKRMDDIRGEFSISSGANGGTIVRLKIPLGKK